MTGMILKSVIQNKMQLNTVDAFMYLSHWKVEYHLKLIHMKKFSGSSMSLGIGK